MESRIPFYYCLLLLENDGGSGGKGEGREEKKSASVELLTLNLSSRSCTLISLKKGEGGGEEKTPARLVIPFSTSILILHHHQQKSPAYENKDIAGKKRREGKKGNGSGTPSRSRNTFLFPHLVPAGELPKEKKRRKEKRERVRVRVTCSLDSTLLTPTPHSRETS